MITEYPTSALIAGLERRKVQGFTGRPERYCHDCAHFAAWQKGGDVPHRYNPCSMKHKMNFYISDDGDPHDNGFYRSRCEDAKFNDA